MFDTLGEDFPGQMYLAWHLPGVATPIITGDKANLERGKQTQSELPARMGMDELEAIASVTVLVLHYQAHENTLLKKNSTRCAINTLLSLIQGL